MYNAQVTYKNILKCALDTYGKELNKLVFCLWFIRMSALKWHKSRGVVNVACMNFRT